MNFIKISPLSESFALFRGCMCFFLLSINLIECGEIRIDLDKLNIGIAIIHMMVFREFASVSFPAKVSGVDSLNGSIHLVRWNVIIVGVRSLVVSSFVYNDIWSKLDVLKVLWSSFSIYLFQLCFWLLCCLWSSFSLSCMVSDFGILYDTVDFFCALNTVTFGLFSNETLSLVVGHCTTGSSDWRNTLDKSNHGCTTFRIKGTVGSSGKLGILKHIIMKGILRKSLLSLISKIGKESLTIIKLDFKSLIIDGGPLSFNSLAANLCRSLVLILQVNFYLFTFLKSKVSVLANNL